MKSHEKFVWKLWEGIEKVIRKSWEWQEKVCSECHFSLTNEYPKIFVIANYSQMKVWIYSFVNIFTNECLNIFLHVVYSRMNIEIYSSEKYLPNIMANEYKWIVKMRKGMKTWVIILISIAEMTNCLFFLITTNILLSSFIWLYLLESNIPNKYPNIFMRREKSLEWMSEYIRSGKIHKY